MKLTVVEAAEVLGISADCCALDQIKSAYQCVRAGRVNGAGAWW